MHFKDDEKCALIFSPDGFCLTHKHTDVTEFHNRVYVIECLQYMH
jgi:hypothetical protein